MKSSNLSRRLVRHAVGAAALLALSSAHAASWRTCEGGAIKWNAGWTNMYINTVSFPAGSAWDADLQNAMWHWNNVKGSGFNFYVGYDTDGTYNKSNGVNEIFFSSAETGSALAVTFTRYSCYWLFGWVRGIDETDIAFNTSLAWNTGTVNYASLGSPFNFELVALHELGHSLGLLHSDGTMATMNSFYPNSGPLGYYKEVDPLPDDRQGVRALYPDGTGETDVEAPLREGSAPGTSSTVSSPTWAYRGTTVNIGVTFANQSTATQTFDIGFYLSTNDYISTWDRWLGSNYGAWGSPGATLTFTRSLTIPSDIAPGTYWLGFLIDPNNAIGEANEGNNLQPMPRTITIY